MRAILFGLIVVGSVAGVATYYTRHVAADSGPDYRTATVQRGDLLSTITATGTVEPEEVVDVGAQVAGLIVEFGKDPRDSSKLIDFGSVVEKDTVLARIDPTSYQAALEQAEATLERSEADLLQLEAKCDQTEQEWKRAEVLRPKKAIADTDYDTAKANSRVAVANLAVGKATVRQNKAALRMAQVNLGYTTIKSPVRGVILARRVNIGQTVVASLNAPSLFLIAKDLRRMQVWASVNEADIGQIHLDMPVRFTVDAYPDETFRGKVTQIRMNATMTQNVVTYTVVVTTDNSSGKLLPYLTANVQFEVDQRSNVLLVPNAALRWKPQTSQIAPSATGVAQSISSEKGQGCLWVAAEGGLVQPVSVKVGTTDGTMTEVSGDNVKEKMDVVVGEQVELAGTDAAPSGSAGGEKTRNPFLPEPPKRKGGPPPPM
jgi:HlyD family secretion protein